MKNNSPLFNFIFFTCIAVWFYGISFIQFSNLHNLLIGFFIFLFYSLLYIGVKKRIIPSDLSNLISFGSFMLTFVGFWVNIINLILINANLRTGDSPFIILINCIIYAIFFCLFYKSLDNSKKNQVQKQSQLTLQSIIRLTFPIIIFVGIFLITLFLNSFLTQINSGIAKQGLTGINILITNLAITITLTSILTYLMEDWLNTAKRSSQEKIFIVETIIGLILTILLVWSKTR